MLINDVLKEFGLDSKEIEVYCLLLKNGPSRASVLAYQTGGPRTSAQNILLRLEQKGLATKSWDQNVAIFTPIHPDELLKITKIEKLKSINKYNELIYDLQEIIPELSSQINLSKRIPNVKFFQGKEAIRKVLFDTLTSKTELKDFANIDAMFEHAKEINNEYVAEREKTNISKRSLLLDTPFARKVYQSGQYSTKSHKGYKWINKNLYPFTLEMNIYDGKVSYVTYVENDFVGVIIENEHIYDMHNSLWNLIWDLLP